MTRTRTPEQILTGLQADGIIDSFRPQSSLSVIASAIRRINNRHDEMAGYDAGFDGGEFSGPAHCSMALAEVQAALDAHGWSAQEFSDELNARTTGKWAWNSGLDDYLTFDDDDEAAWEARTERTNR